MREPTKEEEKVMVYGWPVDGSAGVWVLRFASAEQLPSDFGRINFAMDMEEKEDTDHERVWCYVC
jgi:hypothetical protein